MAQELFHYYSCGTAFRPLDRQEPQTNGPSVPSKYDEKQNDAEVDEAAENQTHSVEYTELFPGVEGSDSNTQALTGILPSSLEKTCRLSLAQAWQEPLDCTAWAYTRPWQGYPEFLPCGGGRRLQG